MWYVADFETTSKAYYDRHGYVKVWLWSICDKNQVIQRDGSDIASFLSVCEEFKLHNIYFHNLKFDGSFILSALFSLGFKEVEDIQKAEPLTFKTVIDTKGMWYEISVKWGNSFVTNFIDSLKILRLPVKKLKETFNLPIDKEIIDYEDYTINDKTLEYIHHDVQCVSYALNYFFDKLPQKLTIGSMSYYMWEQTIKLSKDALPELSDYFLDNYRSAYRGGRCQVNPVYANKVLHNVRRFDVNSMYPSIMRNYWLPYGDPIKEDTPGHYKFELYKVDIQFKIKKGHFPTLLKKHSCLFRSFDEETYYEKTDGIEEIYISNLDLLLVEKHYDIQFLKYEEIWGFKCSKALFKDFVDKFYTLKKESTGGVKVVYKYVLNNLSGKFGSSNKSAKVKVKNRDGKIELYLDGEEKLKKYYLPIAIAITSWGHVIIDNAISSDPNNFVYCDTDSVHTLGMIDPTLIDSKELGKFKLEGIEDTAKYLRTKTYCYKQGDNYDITCAGMTEGIKKYLIDRYQDKLFDIFNYNLTIYEDDCLGEKIPAHLLKLRPVYVKGGCVLEPVSFKIKG